MPCASAWPSRTAPPGACAGGRVLRAIPVKFLLIEVPIVSFAISLTRTSTQVNRLSDWTAANELELIANRRAEWPCADRPPG
jgi:hypothetical protein